MAVCRGSSVSLSSEHMVGKSVLGEGVSVAGRPEKERAWAVLGKLTHSLLTASWYPRYLRAGGARKASWRGWGFDKSRVRAFQ